MPQIFGKKYSRSELLQKVGDISQIGGVTLLNLEDGSQRGVRAAEFKSGTGLRFVSLFDRGMDISQADYSGLPLAWRTPNGDVHPSYYQPENLEWLRTFQGGLLATCGLTYLGAPCVDQGEKLGLHGRFSTLPARENSSGGYWDGDEYFMFTEGVMREAVIFKENLSLRRRIECKLGESRFFVKDIIRNDGFIKTPFMILYHMNFGFPLIDEGTELITPAKKVIARDKDAEAGLKKYNIFDPPIQNYAEQVFYHELESDSDGFVTVKIINKKIGNGFGVYVKYPLDQLPNFIEWKMMGQGTYAVGVEPANCYVEGRSVERERGTLRYLEPGDEKEILLEIGIIDNKSN
jgi:hypothetical protein